MKSVFLLATLAASWTGTTREFCAAFEAPPKDCPVDVKPLEHQCLEILNSALSFKHVRFDPAAARRCAEARSAFVNDPARPAGKRAAVDAACDAAIVGLVQKGAACESALECAAGTVCASKDGGPPGKCVEPLARGATCSGDAINATALAAFFKTWRGVCGKGQHCASVCTPDLGAGAPCTGKDDGECGAGLRCEKGLCARETGGCGR